MTDATPHRLQLFDEYWRRTEVCNGVGIFSSFTITEALLPSSDLLPGHFFIVANGHAFEAEYGSPADLYDITISGNGNDVYSLGEGTTLVDIYGEVGVDGVGTAWEYTDSIATRYFRVTAGTPTWDVSEWTIDGDPTKATPWAR